MLKKREGRENAAKEKKRREKILNPNYVMESE